MIENSTSLIDSILAIHAEDEEQVNFITSTSKKILVQAPAGYGKTKTMVSKLAYILSTRQILTPKKILALTFSVNAAYKIKKDVIEQLPKFLQEEKRNAVLKSMFKN